MEEWIILNEFFILIYCIIMHIKSGILNSTLFLMMLLIYVCIKMIVYIFSSKKNNKIILLCLSIYIILGAFFIDKYIILFLPINMYQIMDIYKLDRFIKIFIAASLMIFVNSSILPEFIVVGSLNYIICSLVSSCNKRILELSEKNDYLKMKNNSLYERMNKDKEYEKQIKYLSQLEERNKIAQEIHDKIGHTISGSLMQLEAVKLLMNKDIDKAQELTNNTIGVLRDGMENIRATLRNIKPPSEQLGINRIKLLLEEFEKNSDISSNLMYNGDIEKISNIQWKVIFDNIKEALTNTMKYSKADKINVSIDVLNKIIKVEAKDNGLGALNIKKGLGVTGMEERTENIGGKMIVDGSSGFSVIMLLPLD